LRIGYLMQEGVEIRRPPFNGPANHVRHVINKLERRGHRIRVLVRLEGRIWKSDNLSDFEPVTVRWMDKGVLRLFERAARRIQFEMRLPYAAMFESLRFAKACLQELRGYDLFYERLGWVGYGGGLAARWSNIPLVLEDNGDALFDLEAKGVAPNGTQRRLSVALMQKAVRCAAHVVSTGVGWREQFIKRWAFESSKATTVENGTMLTHLLSRERLRSFRIEQETGGTVTLAYLGGFYPWHGISVLLPALARALGRGAQAKLLMIGSGDGFDEAQRMVTKLGLHEAVTFAGHLKPEQYAPVLATADIGVSPYCCWPEFSGLKVLDYKAAGLPTIASGKNGQPPTLKTGQTGLIVPPCDEGALCEAIIRLCADRDLRRAMGRAARIEAEQVHSWEHTAEQLEQVFAKVLGERVQ
jgi:glycosyltransferase involved in cell wall biosynthesis